MAGIFRKIRSRFLGEKKISNYLIYAIGEIALVMIGILLALQVNNWNERRKSERELDAILKDVAHDLKRDTLVAGQIINYYQIAQKASQDLIDGKITKENFNAYPLARSLVTTYQPFTIQKKGFEQLQNFKSAQLARNDTLTINIGQFYTTLTDLISNSNDFVKQDVFKNLESFREKPWFIDWTQAKLTDDMIAYFTQSEDYKKRVAAHKILATDNHLKFIEAYKLSAQELLKQIDQRIETLQESD